MGPDGAWKRFLSDGLHLSPEGQRLVFDLLLDTITKRCPSLAPDRLPLQFPHHADVDAAVPASTFMRGGPGGGSASGSAAGGGGSGGVAGIAPGLASAPGTPGAATPTFSPSRPTGHGAPHLRPVECETELLSLRGVTSEDSDGVVELLKEGGGVEDLLVSVPHLAALAHHGVTPDTGRALGVTCGIFDKQVTHHPRVLPTHAHGGSSSPGVSAAARSPGSPGGYGGGGGGSGSSGAAAFTGATATAAAAAVSASGGGAGEGALHLPPPALQPVVATLASSPMLSDGGSASASASVSAGLVGLVGLAGVDTANGTAELWLLVAPEARGRQVATTACRAFLRAAMASMPWLRRVTLRHRVDQPGTGRLADKLGFRSEGVAVRSVVRGGVGRDVALRSLLRDDMMLSSVDEVVEAEAEAEAEEEEAEEEEEAVGTEEVSGGAGGGGAGRGGSRPGLA